jgi:hypothetical protein
MVLRFGLVWAGMHYRLDELSVCYRWSSEGPRNEVKWRIPGFVGDRIKVVEKESRSCIVNMRKDDEKV